MKKILLVVAMLTLSACGNNAFEGAQGPAGAPGQNGTNGTAGADGTVITVVQFCVGVTPVYPSTFPENGICIEGKIYAVYSANDGFLTEIVPGVYSSNAVGSSCNFTVLPNCVIQN